MGHSGVGSADCKPCKPGYAGMFPVGHRVSEAFKVSGLETTENRSLKSHWEECISPGYQRAQGSVCFLFQGENLSVEESLHWDLRRNCLVTLAYLSGFRVELTSTCPKQGQRGSVSIGVVESVLCNGQQHSACDGADLVFCHLWDCFLLPALWKFRLVFLCLEDIWK